MKIEITDAKTGEKYFFDETLVDEFNACIKKAQENDDDKCFFNGICFTLNQARNIVYDLKRKDLIHF